jgi:hypothetical protein
VRRGAIIGLVLCAALGWSTGAAAAANPGPTHVFLGGGGHWLYSDPLPREFERGDLVAQPASFRWTQEGTLNWSELRRLRWTNWRASQATAVGQLCTCHDFRPCTAWRSVRVTFGAPQRHPCPSTDPFPSVVRIYTRVKADVRGAFPANRWQLIAQDQDCLAP